MNDQQYLDFLKVLENELLSFRWGCIFDSQKNVACAEYGNFPVESNALVPKQCNDVFEEAIKFRNASSELVAQDEHWILLMRQFAQSPLRCFILLRSGGVTTGWARDTLKQKIRESSFT
ncbi:MAG: hypothetical protein WCX28_14500 [Bacteriovoracaceae bacterium]|nr:hypothetical protein [Bacteroidota bacterium]